jgi:hypothetical protein
LHCLEHFENLTVPKGERAPFASRYDDSVDSGGASSLAAQLLDQLSQGSGADLARVSVDGEVHARTRNRFGANAAS